MKLNNLLLILGFAIIPSLSFADGKKISATCAACHGDKGISENPLWPNLAGQKKEYLIKQLKDFKAGVRNDPVMSAQAKLLSDSDVEDVAKYYSGLKAK